MHSFIHSIHSSSSSSSSSSVAFGVRPRPCSDMWVPFFARGRAIYVRNRAKTLDALQYDEYKSSQSIYVTPDDTRAVMGLASRALRASSAVALTCAHVVRVSVCVRRRWRIA